MLNVKFVAPVIGKIRADLTKFFLLNNNRYSSCKYPQKTIESSTPSTCNEYREKLAECPKRKPACRKQQRAPECKVKSVVEDYRRVNQDVTNRGKSMLNTFQARSRTILSEFKSNIKALTSTEERQLNELSDGIKKKVQRLLVLDPSFGSCKRKSALMLDYETRQALNELQCNVLPRLKRVECIINDLESDLSTHVNRASSLILSCRKCKNPDSLEKCIEENARYAEKILEKTAQKLEFGLDKIEKAQREILDYHKRSMVELMAQFREKNKSFSEHLDNCIFAAKNK